MEQGHLQNGDERLVYIHCTRSTILYPIRSGRNKINSNHNKEKDVHFESRTCYHIGLNRDRCKKRAGLGHKRGTRDRCEEGTFQKCKGRSGFPCEQNDDVWDCSRESQVQRYGLHLPCSNEGNNCKVSCHV